MRRDIYQAIADPTRRVLLALLTLGAMTPDAIAGHFGSVRQGVSKYLQMLADCGAVDQAQRGREIYYHLNLDKKNEPDHWLEQFRKIWESRFNQLDEVLLTIKKISYEKQFVIRLYSRQINQHRICKTRI